MSPGAQHLTESHIDFDEMVERIAASDQVADVLDLMAEATDRGATEDDLVKLTRIVNDQVRFLTREDGDRKPKGIKKLLPSRFASPELDWTPESRAELQRYVEEYEAFLIGEAERLARLGGGDVVGGELPKRARERASIGTADPRRDLNVGLAAGFLGTGAGIVVSAFTLPIWVPACLAGGFGLAGAFALGRIARR